MAYERVQILLEPRQHRALKQAAKRAQKSVSELVREITEQYFTKSEDTEMLKTLEALEVLSTQILEKQGVYHGDPLAEARAEREAQMDEILKDMANAGH
jgi:hypothetical protein